MVYSWSPLFDLINTLIIYLALFKTICNINIYASPLLIDEKLKTETDKSKRTQLLMEQMLRGLYLNQNDTYR